MGDFEEYSRALADHHHSTVSYDETKAEGGKEGPSFLFTTPFSHEVLFRRETIRVYVRYVEEGGEDLFYRLVRYI